MIKNDALVSMEPQATSSVFLLKSSTKDIEERNMNLASR